MKHIKELTPKMTDAGKLLGTREQLGDGPRELFAEGTYIGQWGLPPDESIYLRTETVDDGKPINGSKGKSYTMHFKAPDVSDDLLSNKQWGVGPTAVALKQSNGWTHRILANHICGLDGSPPDDKEKVNQPFLQPFLSYTTKTLTTYGINTESTYDWQVREWSVPINLNVTQLLKIGGHPLTIQTGPRYWLDRSGDGPQGWGFRAAVTLLFPC